MTFGVPFGIIFSTFLENGESVKSAAGRSCSAERATGVFRLGYCLINLLFPKLFGFCSGRLCSGILPVGSLVEL